MDRRNSGRSRARLDVLVQFEDHESAGMLGDISHSGALVEDCTLLPPVGAAVRLYLFPPVGRAFSLEGTVSRHAEAGFALSYALHDVGLRSLVDVVLEHLAPAAAS